METNSRDILLYARLVDLHRRKTEAELRGYGTKTYETLIELYQREVAEIVEARSKQLGDPKPEAA